MSSAAYVNFAVKYDDGHIEYMRIDSETLRTGDHVVRMIAREHQQKGELASGKIASVERV